MTSWQRPVRIAVLVFGLAAGVIVFRGFRERPPVAVPGATPRLEEKAVSETWHAAIQQVSGLRKAFDVKCTKSVTYEDGSTTCFDVRIATTNRDGREVVVTAREGRDQGGSKYALTGDVHLKDEAGFELTTAASEYDGGSQMARATGPVSFSKGRMRGTGIGMSYDLAGDVLHIADEARIDVSGDESSSMQSSAGSATLDRRQDLLTLDRDVHAVHGLQATDADRAVARLSAEEDVITFVELRGHAKVEGGEGPLRSMRANDIDLDYTDTGKALERAVLIGDATVVLESQDGSAARVVSADRAIAQLAEGEVIRDVELRGAAKVDGGSGPLQSMHARDIDLRYTSDGKALDRAVLAGSAGLVLAGKKGAAGRRLGADRLDAALAPDGTLSRLTGEGRVSMELPADAGAPARSVVSETMEGTGGAGGALTSARFAGRVVFQEQASGTGRPRVARSGELALAMSDDAISSAVFRRAVTFEEDDLRATAAEARYEPGVGRLALSGVESGALPTVSDEQLRVEAQAIAIGLEKRALDATGKVKTLLNPAKREGRGTGRGRSESTRLPGLFAQDQAANVTSARLVHDGEGGVAHYSGSVWLWQGEKEIRAEAIDINQTTGDLTAYGNASSTLVFDSGRSDGQAPEIRYADATRVITYASTQGSQAPRRAAARLRGPQGDLAGVRIEVILKESQVDRIEAYELVTALVDKKTITGHRFTYRAEGEQYEVVGTPHAPMTVRIESCQETMGNTLTFDRSTDTMTVDGRSTRMQTKNPCRPQAPR
jgi:lipopolysaccharide export system protein LptA